MQDLDFYKAGNDLKINIKGTTDALIIQSWFSGDSSKVDQFRFADNSILTSAQMDAQTFKVYGTGAVDYLTGSSSSDLLYGYDGNDTLAAGAGNDVLDGGTGNDTLTGDTGSDTYKFNIGSGTDSINNYAADYATAIDTVEFGAGITANDLDLFKVNGDLRINIKGTADVLVIQSWFSGVPYKVDQFKFADNSIMTAAQIDVQTFKIYGTSGVDCLTGSNSSDILDGGAGNDTLYGASGNDTYIIGRGYGNDTFVDNDTTSGNTDVGQFGSDISAEQLWFKHVGSNLEVSVIGTSDKFTINNWYGGSQYHVEQFRSGDGKLLTDSSVDALVAAMASFTAPAAGQTTLPTNYQTTLAPVIAANWH